MNVIDTNLSARLPGFAQIFLLNLYLAVPAFLTLQVGMAMFNRWLEPEVIFWGLVCGAFGIWSLIAAVGLHTRSAWAPACCGALATGLIFLSLAGALRVLVEIWPGLFRSHYGYYGGLDGLTALLPAAMLVAIPALLAWRRYFSESPRVKAAFGLPDMPNQISWATPVMPGPIGVLKTFSAVILVHNLLLLIMMAPSLGGRMTGLLLFLAGLALPQIVFPVLTLAMVKPGCAPRTLFRLLGLWMIVLCVWGHIFNFQFLSMLTGEDAYQFYSLSSMLNFLPVNRFTQVLLLGALLWAVAASREARAWLGNQDRQARQDQAEANASPDTGRPEGFGPAVLLLSYLTITQIPTACRMIVVLTTNLGSTRLMFVILLLSAACALFFCVYSLLAWLRGRAQAVLLGRAALLACLVWQVLIIVSQLIDLAGKDADYHFSGLYYYMPSFCADVLVIVLGLCFFFRLSDPSAARGGAAMAAIAPEPPVSPTPAPLPAPLPIMAFQVFCLFVVCKGVLGKLISAVIVAVLSGDMEKALSGLSSLSPYAQDRETFIVIPLLAALVFPLLSLWAARRQSPNRGALLAMIACWGAYSLLQLSLSLASGAGLSNPIYLFSYEIQFILFGLAGFVWYFNVSEEAARWFGWRVGPTA